MAFRPEDDPYPLSLPMMHSPNMNPYTPESTGTSDQFFGAPYISPLREDFGHFEAEDVFSNAMLVPQSGYRPGRLPDNPTADKSHSSESSPSSSSNSSDQHRRHVSSNSSRSATHETDQSNPNPVQVQTPNMASSNISLKNNEETTKTEPTDNDLDRQMNELFDFDSAANSPGDSMETEKETEKETETETSSGKPIPGMTIPQHQQSPQHTAKKVAKPQTLAILAASRSTVSTPCSFKPENSFHNPNPHTRPFDFRENAALQSNASYDPPYGTPTAPYLVANTGFVGPNSFGHPPPMLIPPAPTLQGAGQLEQLRGPWLKLEQIAPKTRVETQIPIQMTLFPLPPGITKLHLPRRTMAKPKLIAKPQPGRSRNMLELDVMPVCASAMRKPALYCRALAMARGEVFSSPTSSHFPRSSTEGPVRDGASSTKIEPKDGGPIQICDGCVTRERKRANRRIEKEETPEDILWKQGEKERIVVFNETEIVEWKPYGSTDFNEPAGRRAKGGGRGKKKGDPGEEALAPTLASAEHMAYGEGAKQVSLMMRITCYCRHQGEPEGFQVIITIKDHLGNCVAQEISSPILITDDHKTSTLQNEGVSPTTTTTTTDASHLPKGGSFLPPGPPIHAAVAPHLFNPGQSQSSTELPSHPFYPQKSALHRPATSASLHHFGPMQASRSTGSSTPCKQSSYQTSATLTPRNLSRQVSPTATSGPTPKRRKGSGNSSFHNRPCVNLSMTRMSRRDITPDRAPRPSLSPSSSSDASEGLIMAPITPTARTATTTQADPAVPVTALTSSSTLGMGAANSASDHASESSPQQSTPTSASDSDPIPDLDMDIIPLNRNGTQSPQPVQPLAQTDMRSHAQALHHSLLGLPGAMTPASELPMVYRTIPTEGPISGGLEVTILGEGLYHGLDVCFAGALATRTVVLNSQTIVCCIPPSFQPGLVPVTLRGHHQADPPVLFRYVDTDERDLMRLALTVFHHRNTGKFANPGDVARSIIGSQANGNPLPANITQHLQNSELSAMDLELSILAVIDMIDQADTAIAPCYNLCRTTGHTMLHLSASLGYHKLVAGLLARGAHPDLRDRNGMSAMHMACLHGRSKVVRKLLSAGGDPSIRSLLGVAPIDMATTYEVYHVVASIERHTRSRSFGATPISHLSRASSPASIEPDVALNNAIVEAYQSRAVTPSPIWAQSRRNSASEQQQQHFFPAQNTEDVASNTHRASVAAAMAAYFQQGVQKTLPHLQVPPLPTFEAYQEHPMVRRISSLVPRMNAAPPPPSYEEIYPESSQKDVRTASVLCALGEAVIDKKCAMAWHFEHAPEDQHHELRLARERNVKKLSNDRKLFFVWIPLLILVIIAMTKDWAPDIVRGVGQIVGYVQEHLAA
ncbi:MAG: hypothetical protein Q9223_004095 [Gallowayella weberi]